MKCFYKFNTQLKNTPTDNIIQKIHFDKDGVLRLATADKGFGTFDTASKQFYFYSDDVNTRQLLPGTFCSGFYRDNQNNFWLTYADGLYKVQYYENRFRFQPVKVVRSTNGVFYTVSCMLEDVENNTLFIGTSFADGLHIINRNTGQSTTLSFPIMAKGESVMLVKDLMQDHNGNVWVLTRDHIFRYDRIKRKLVLVEQPPAYTVDIPSNHFTAITEDKKRRSMDCVIP